MAPQYVLSLTEGNWLVLRPFTCGTSTAVPGFPGAGFLVGPCGAGYVGATLGPRWDGCRWQVSGEVRHELHPGQQTHHQAAS
jgi:hypothetical protein